MLTSTGAASGWKSTDIITLRQVMVTMENMKLRWPKPSIEVKPARRALKKLR